MAAIRRTTEPDQSRKLPWELPGAHLLFHYTTVEAAAVIGEEAHYMVSTHRNSRVGSGLFLTNAEPGELDDRELLTLLWANQYGVERIRGVIVLRSAPEVLHVERFAPGQWVHRAPPGTVLDLTELLVGYGIRPRTEWLFTSGLYVARSTS
jgi:hypothetical protein